MPPRDHQGIIVHDVDNRIIGIFAAFQTAAMIATASRGGMSAAALKTYERSLLVDLSSQSHGEDEVSSCDTMHSGDTNGQAMRKLKEGWRDWGRSF